MRKKIILFVLSYFIFSIGMSEVNAAKAFTGSYLPTCLNNASCIEACEYENTWKLSGKNVTDKIIIYYNYSSKDMMVRFTTDGYKKMTTYSIDNKYVHSQNNLFKEKSSCPKYAYVDGKNMDEVCFSFNKDYCLNGKLGNKFKGSSKATYNFEDQIKLYYSDNDNYFYNVTCDNFELSNLETKLVNDFSKNYLNGHNLPSFIENNEVYKTQNQAQKDKIKKYLEKCKKEITLDENKTDSQKQESLDKLNYSDEEIDEMLDEVDSQIKSGTNLGDYKIETEETNCTSLFGVNEPGYPAYYIITAFNIIKYLAILILIVFTIMDYFKAIISKDEDSISKSNGKFIKRFIMAIVIFVLPILLETVMEWSGLVDDVAICGITNVNE